MDAALRALFSRPWAIEPSHGAAFVESLLGAAAVHAAGAKSEPRRAAVRADVSGVRVLSMSGPMLHKPPAWLAEFGMEYTDTLGLAAQVRAADADPAVKSISINADTPGGMVGGIHELSDAIANARKPVSVHVDGMLASAGVWAASGADSISATRSSQIGSIGVYTVRVDRSQMLASAGIKVHLVSSGGVKGGGADGVVTQAMLSEDARVVGQLRDEFVAAVSAGRGRDLSARATGQIWLAADAERIGLIDSITGAGASDAPTPEDTMDVSNLAAIAAQHPTKAGEILAMAAAGKTDGEIQAHLAAQAHADEVSSAKAEAVAAKAAAEKAAPDLKIEADKCAALVAEVAALKAQVADADKRVGAVAVLAQGAANDPGADASAEAQTITRAEYERNPSAHAASVSSGKLKITA
jgi:ClpP class serine protease